MLSSVYENEGITNHLHKVQINFSNICSKIFNSF